jgi:hypothetical protein
MLKGSSLILSSTATLFSKNKKFLRQKKEEQKTQIPRLSMCKKWRNLVDFVCFVTLMTRPRSLLAVILL